MKTATLTSDVTVHWTGRRGQEREADVTARYTYDGLNIVLLDYRASVDDCEGDDFAELVYDAIERVADDHYQDWLADQAAEQED